MASHTAITDAAVTELTAGKRVRAVTRTGQPIQSAQMADIAFLGGGDVVFAQTQFGFRNDTALELAAGDV